MADVILAAAMVLVVAMVLLIRRENDWNLGR